VYFAQSVSGFTGEIARAIFFQKKKRSLGVARAVTSEHQTLGLQ
jgi:hypothetical protein